MYPSTGLPIPRSSRPAVRRGRSSSIGSTSRTFTISADRYDSWERTAQGPGRVPEEEAGRAGQEGPLDRLGHSNRDGPVGRARERRMTLEELFLLAFYSSSDKDACFNPPGLLQVCRRLGRRRVRSQRPFGKQGLHPPSGPARRKRRPLSSPPLQLSPWAPPGNLSAGGLRPM